MLYFSSEVKMEGPKEKWGGGQMKSGGAKIFRGGIRASHFQFASSSMIYHACETVTLMY